MKNFIQYYKNARKCVEQIKNGEWVPKFNSLDGSHLTAKRENLELWLANGPFFTDMDNTKERYFGYFWRHYVWWFGVRKLKKDADRSIHKNMKAPLL